MENTKEKLNKLAEVGNQLKKEFIGLDDIIDRIINSIKPWYVTPEILDKPLVISLWGITGTGKSSVIIRLLELLGIKKKFVFDSGELNKDDVRSSTFADAIAETLSIEDVIDSNSEVVEEDTVFVFDEFQHARTINERGEEVTQAKIRQLWNLIDDGKLLLKRSDNYITNQINQFAEDFEIVANNFGDRPLNHFKIADKEVIDFILNNIGAFWYLERAQKLFGIRREDDQDSDSEKEGTSGDPLRPLAIADSSIIRYASKLLKKRNDGLGMGTLYNCKTIAEFYDLIKIATKSSKQQPVIQFKKTLIFLIGNLDEAFLDVNEVDPDISASRFKRQIDNVTIADIKRALQVRFRAEQVARIGNNIIKYPAFSEESFIQIIRLNLDNLLESFQKSSGKTIRYSDDVINLIYSEGVYPTQGCRPIFTTITNIFTSVLSNVLIDFDNDVDLMVEVKNPQEGYRLDTKTIIFTSRNTGKTCEYSIPLVLGTLRNPKHNVNRYLYGAHEAGHAIITAYATGEPPEEIVGTAATGGGFVTNFSNDEQLTKEKIRSRILIYLGGYVAEKIMFSNPKEDPEGLKISAGASKDISGIWTLIRNAAYCWGYFGPIKYSSHTVNSSADGKPEGLDSSEIIDKLIKRELDMLIIETEKILSLETKLISAVGLALAEKGSITSNEFLEFVKQYGNNITIEYMKQIKEKLSINYYEKKLKEIGI